MDYICNAPKYFVDCCIEEINDENRRIEKENIKIEAQKVIDKMKKGKH